MDNKEMDNKKKNKSIIYKCAILGRRCRKKLPDNYIWELENTIYLVSLCQEDIRRMSLRMLR